MFQIFAGFCSFCRGTVLIVIVAVFVASWFRFGDHGSLAALRIDRGKIKLDISYGQNCFAQGIFLLFLVEKRYTKNSHNVQVIRSGTSLQ